MNELYISDDEAQNETPNHSENQLAIPLHDICGTATSGDEIEIGCMLDKPSAPMLVRCTPISLILSSARLRFSAFCTLRREDDLL